MSRSRKKTPIFLFTCAESQHDGKKRSSRMFRRKTKQNVYNAPIRSIEVMSPYDLGGDGKRYCKNYNKKQMRK